jgi:hypothetical protein
MAEGNVQVLGGDFQHLLNQQEKRNRLDQLDPFGNRLDFSKGQVTQQFGPGVQALINQLMGQAGQPLNLQAFAPGDFGASMQAAEGATFDRMMSLLNPQFDLQEGRMQQRLANQGLPQASAAYGAETGRFQDTRNRAMEQAALQAVLAGQGVQQQGFQQGLGTHQQNIGQQLAQYQMPFDQGLSMFGMAQPQYANVPGVDVMGAYSPMLGADMAQKADNFSFGRHVLPGAMSMLGNIGAGAATGFAMR